MSSSPRVTRLSSPVFEVGISPSPLGTADAALARDNDNPATPNTGRALLRFVFEAFEFDMGESSTPFGRPSTPRQPEAWRCNPANCSRVPIPKMTQPYQAHARRRIELVAGSLVAFPD